MFCMRITTMDKRKPATHCNDREFTVNAKRELSGADEVARIRVQ